MNFEQFLIETKQPVSKEALVARQIVAEADSGKPLEASFSELTRDMESEERDEVASILESFMEQGGLDECTIL